MIVKKRKREKDKYKNIIRFSKLLIKKNKIQLIIAFILVILTSIMDLILPQFTKYIIDYGIMKKSITLTFKFISLSFIISILSALLNFMLEYLYSIMKNKVTIDLRIKILDHLSKLSGNYYLNIKTGNMLSIIQDDINIIENFDSSLIFSIVANLLTSAVSIVLLVGMKLDLFLMVLVLQVSLVLIQNKLTNKIANQTNIIRKKYGENSSLIQEYISNIMNIVLSKSKLKFFKTYLRKEKDLIKKYINIDMTIGGNMLIAKIFSALIMVCIYGYGGYIVIKGNMTLGTLLAFQEYTTMFIGPCINIIRANNRIQQTKVSIDRVYFLLDEESDIKINDKGYKLLKGNINEIEFKDVYFKYLNKEKADSNYVLKDINLMFKKGATSAIVGESGCGKTTLVNLIYRFWDVNEGKILIDGINIKDINLLTLRKSISVVSQDILMLDDSIRNNKILSSTINDEEILRICEVVGLTDFVKGLKDGLDTVIGEKGVKISGGQRQRISIARALVNDNDILVFDEATSALDNISQAYILKNMKKYMQDKIVIIIAHRLSTIKDADNIYVLHNGKIVESGNKEELKLNDGIYNKLVKADA